MVQPCRRQRTCLVLSAFILVFGIVLLGIGLWFSLQPHQSGRNRKCHRVNHLLVGVYLVIAGIAGFCGYCPRRHRSHNLNRGSRLIFLVFCALVTLVVLMDNSALSCIAAVPRGGDTKQHHEVSSLSSILSIVEVVGMHLAQLLCAICFGLSCPDLWTHKKDTQKPTKKPSKQALHLPEARTHVQEAAGTGAKVTVVSLPETDGIVYAVPEDQYVIRRGDATYMAPIGNTQLTAFFPTYRSQSQSE